MERVMNTHGITIEEVFTHIGESINYGSYNTMDFIFNVVFSSMFIAAAIFIIWFAVSMINIHNSK